MSHAIEKVEQAAAAAIRRRRCALARAGHAMVLPEDLARVRDAAAFAAADGTPDDTASAD